MVAIGLLLRSERNWRSHIAHISARCALEQLGFAAVVREEGRDTTGRDGDEGEDDEDVGFGVRLVHTMRTVWAAVRSA